MCSDVALLFLEPQMSDVSCALLMYVEKQLLPGCFTHFDLGPFLEEGGVMLLEMRTPGSQRGSGPFRLQTRCLQLCFFQLWYLV